MMKGRSNGLVRIRLLSGDPVGALSVINRAGIPLIDGVCLDDGITVVFSVNRYKLGKLQQLAKQKGYEMAVISLSEFDHFRSLLKRRWLLVVLTFVIGILTTYLPTRVLFVTVVGNENVPSRWILEECADYGVYFGAPRKAIRSEKVKNGLLGAIDELQWVGVTTSGCVATITVKERPIEKSGTGSTGIHCLVAGIDGQVITYTVTKGTALCTRGVFVKKGDVLVSGYSYGENFARAVGAEGEVYARTLRTLDAITPENWMRKEQILRQEEKYSLLIGKKQINFSKGSGISGGTCDKIYKENYMTLPGGFVLPFGIRVEVSTYYESDAVTLEREIVLQEVAEAHLKNAMVAGTIGPKDEIFSYEEGCVRLQGEYVCTEMIARTENEEILKPYGNDQ